MTNPSEAITHVSASEVAGVFAIYQQDNETYGNDEIKQIAGGHAYEIKLALKPEARPQDLQARLLLMRFFSFIFFSFSFFFFHLFFSFFCIL